MSSALSGALFVVLQFIQLSLEESFPVVRRERESLFYLRYGLGPVPGFVVCRPTQVVSVGEVRILLVLQSEDADSILELILGNEAFSEGAEHTG